MGFGAKPVNHWGESGANHSRMSGVRGPSAGTEPQVTVRDGIARKGHPRTSNPQVAGSNPARRAGQRR